MPHRHAHYYLLALFPVIALAFWPAYFSRLGAAPLALHFHGVTAFLWILLLAGQSWTMHHRERALHRTMGKASFVLFPLFLAGGLLVIQSMSRTTSLGVSPFYNLYGSGLAVHDVISSIAIAAFYFQAMKWRWKVNQHARYMLATILFLLGPIFARVLPILPPLAMSGPADLHRFESSYHLANMIAVVIAVFLAWRSGRHGRPYAFAAIICAGQSLAFATLPWFSSWQTLFVGIGSAHAALLAGLGIALGAAVAWLGWNAVPKARGPAIV